MRSTVLSVAVVLGMTFFLARALWAAHPLFSEDAGTQGPGGVLVESNVNYLKDNEFTSTAVPVALSLGLGESIDVGVEMPYLWLHPSPATGHSEHGFSDIIFKFKQRFFERGEQRAEGEQQGEEGSEQSFAYQILYAQPSGSEEKGLGAGSSRWAVRMISTTEWRSFEFNANLGYESSGRALRRGNLSFDNVLALTVAAKYERPKPWEPVVELAVLRVKEPEAVTRIATALIGLVYEPSDKFYVDAGIRAGLNKSSEDYAVLAGFGVGF